MKQFLKRFQEKHAALWQFIKYALLSGLATVVEVIVFALLNFWIFRPLKSVDFVWWILNYNAATGGGLGGFYATAVSYIAAQVFNFIVQRKHTFGSTNNVAFSAVMYTAMVIAVWFFQIYMGAVLMNALSPLIGNTWGDLLSKCLCMTMSFAIQYPMNKFVIMRKQKRPTENEQ